MTSDQQRVFLETSSGLFDGTLAYDDARAVNFAQQLAEDPDASALFLEFASLDVDLQWLCNLGESAQPQFSLSVGNIGSSSSKPAVGVNDIQVAAASAEKRPVTPVLGLLGRTRAAFRRPAYWSVLAAGLLFAGYFVAVSWNMLGKTPNGAGGNDIPIAVISDMQDAEWSGDSSPRRSQGENVHGDEVATIKQGEPLKITSGLVGLKLKQGTTLIVEGPAEWSIDGENRATLRHGKLVAKVPQQAIGFALETPTATIIDLGTEFGVQVNPYGTDVHVVKGEIDVNRAGNSSKSEPGKLRAGQSAQITAEGSKVENSPAVPEQFKRLYAAGESKTSDVATSDRSYAEAILKAEPLLYWQFDVRGENDAVKNSVADRYPAQLAGGAKIVSPAGAGKSAFVRFGGPGVVTCDEPLSGLMVDDYSIEFWTRFSQPPTGTFVALYETGPGLKHASLMAAEPNKRLRFLHRVPPGNRGGSDVYATPQLALETWHHFVGFKWKSTILLYIDGRHIGQATVRQGDTADLRVALGQVHHAATPGSGSFVGDLDEFAIYPRALSEREIKAHYTLGKSVFTEDSK